jgi:hypothetical protein
MTRHAAESIEQSVAAAGERMISAVRRLDDLTASVAQTLTRSASNLGDSLSQTIQRADAEVTQAALGLTASVARTTSRVEAEVSQVLVAIAQQRVESADALSAAQAAATAIREDAEVRLQEHLELWRSTLNRANAALSSAHGNLDVEYARGLEGFALSGKAFAELTARTVAQVEALPNPAARLSGLWDGVRELESTLNGAITGSVEGLMKLRERSEQATTELGRLSVGAGAAADTVAADSTRLATALQRELRQMNVILEEYVSLLETTTSSLRVG